VKTGALVRSRIGAAAVLVVGVAAGLWLVALQREVQSRFSGEMFELPSRVYSRALELVPGVDPARAAVVPRLERLGYRRVRARSVGPGEFATGQRWIAFGPPLGAELRPGRYQGVTLLELDERGRVARIGDGTGGWLERGELPQELLAELHGPYRSRRQVIPLTELPPHLVDAVIAVEDQRFYDHPGIDPLRIAGALVANLRAGRIAQGGSTITQQLVKNFYLSPERTWQRKLREAVMAVLLEVSHTKQEILEAYLNEIYLGQRGPIAIHGMGEAASHYFGKDVRALDHAEAALLAGVVAAPGVYSPFAHPEAAKERRDRVLRLLHEEAKLDDEQLAQALAEPLVVRSAPRDGDASAPWLAEQLRRELAPRFDPGQLEQEGLVIDSTVDARLQRLAVRAVAAGLAELEKGYKSLRRKDAPLQAALVALDPRTGDVLAHVGGRDFGANQFDHAMQARRQPGSAFKPVVALAALGRTIAGPPAFTLASVLEDEELRLPSPDGEWVPANFDNEFRGRVTLREALEASLNVPIVRVGLAIGPERIVETARRLGITGPMQPVPSLALGVAEVTLLELVRAYAVFASGGSLPQVRTWSAVRDAALAPLAESPIESEPAFDPAEVYLVTSALEGAVDHGTGSAARRLGVEGPLAGKTGTTNEYRDAWFVGYTRDLVVGVWVGFDDGRSLRLPASAVALPLFARFMRDAFGANVAEPFTEPPGIEEAEVNRASGLRAGPGCWGDPELFLAGTAPGELCVAPAWELATRPFRWLDRVFGGRRPPRSGEFELYLEPLPPPEREFD
jgi:penicillin-binding protein 1B